MSRASTDTVLWDWRFGPTQAERLCADLLQVEGFSDIDPQSPLGGPDGRKDILCNRDGASWVTAVYFPPTRSDYKDVEEKFCHDLEGVALHQRDSFAFFTNQPLTPGQRSSLAGEAEPVPVELYHQERIRSILDSPRGYGLRLEYLRIAMTEEEQHSLWSTLGDEITGRLTRQEVYILDLHRKMDLVLAQTMLLESGSRVGESSLATQPAPQLTQFPTADLQVGDILWIHRLLCDGTPIPRPNRGRFRSTSVWIGNPGTSPDAARFIPPPPEQIKELLTDLMSQWRADYGVVSEGDEAHRIAAVSAFHHGFLSIHPFLDGNGRVGRALLQQQVFELTGRHLEASFTQDPASYFDALSAANQGDRAKLSRLIRANLE